MGGWGILKCILACTHEFKNLEFNISMRSWGSEAKQCSLKEMHWKYVINNP